MNINNQAAQVVLKIPIVSLKYGLLEDFENVL